MSTDAESEARSLLLEIRQVFKDVRRGNGVTLHETEVIDMYGSVDERRLARKKDTDQSWWEVRDEWIEEFGGVGGLSFFDEAGFRYYLPAYMSYWLKTREEPNSLTLHLSHKYLDIDRLFTPTEMATIARFVEFVCRVHGEECADEKVFDHTWARYYTAQ